jgi:hypothetical protein
VFKTCPTAKFRPARAAATCAFNLALAIAAGTAITAVMAHAQPSNPDRNRLAPRQAPAPGSKPRTPADSSLPSPVTFSDQPMQLDSVGLTMSVPADAAAEITSAGSSASARIVGPEGLWLINVATPRTSNPDVTSAEAVDKIVTDLFASAGVAYDKENRKLLGVSGAILEARHAVMVNGREGQRVYVGLPPSASGAVMVRGYTVFKLAPTQFATFEFVCPGGEFDKLRSIYETTLATATFEDVSRAQEQRAIAISNARSIWAEIDEAALREIIQAGPAERWERLYRPASTGLDADATEIGYRRVMIKMGTRGDVDPGRKTRTGADNQEGLIVRLDARAVDDAKVVGKDVVRGRIIDSRSIFFMTLDRNEETWAVHNSVREVGNTMKSTEKGGRLDKSMVVDVEGTGQPPRAIRPVFEGEGYVSRAESILIPTMLVRKQAKAEVGTYVYQSDAGRIRLRRDLLDQPPETPELWRVTTRLGEDKQPQVTFYNSKGELVRTELADGSVWEPITMERLVSLWRSKGLPMD